MTCSLEPRFVVDARCAVAFGRALFVLHRDRDGWRIVLADTLSPFR